MERAFKQLGETYSQARHLHDDWTLLKEYPLSRELLAVTSCGERPMAHAGVR